MADNVAITPGAGATVATDDVGGVQYQRVKLTIGADGTATDVAPGQAASAASIPVVLANDQSSHPVTVSGSVTVSGPLTDTQLRATAVPVSVSGTPTVSGTVTANAGTNLNTSALAVETGGHLAAIDAAQGAQADAAATTDTGTFSVVALVKRLLGKFAGLPVALGQAAAASSMPVTLSNENINDQLITGQATQTASGNNIILAAAGTGATDCQQYRMIGLQIVPTGTVSSGVVTFEGSNDNTNFQAIPLYDVNSLTANPVTTVSPATGVFRYFAGAVVFRYFRARISTVIGGGGSLQAFTMLRMADFVHPQQTVTQGTAANLLATVSATNLSCNVAQINAVTPLMGNGVTGTGSLRVTLASDTTTNTNPLSTQRPTPTESFINSAATTNATSVKASAGTVFALTASNTHATVVAYVKLYNKASAPTVGTDVPVIVLQVPAAGARAEIDCGAYGHRFGTGIALAITAAAADSDTTAVGANDVKVAASYV